MRWRPRRTAAMVLVLVAAASAAGPGRAQDLKRPEEQLAAIYALKVQLEVEQKRLDQALTDYGRIADKRETTRARLRDLYRDLDDMVEGKSESTPEQIDQKEADIGKAEIELENLTRDGRELRARMSDSQQRIALLQDRVSRLRKSLPSDNESLTGTWDVSYLPSGDKGVFTLRQSGTVIAGEYVLDGGWRGSLQGTFVNGKILLHRIDSKLGHSQDLEGTVASDGHTLRGRWQNFILSGGVPASGDWVADKRERSES
jgi:hypothetical protein